jgi:hypothetical protein
MPSNVLCQKETSEETDQTWIEEVAGTHLGPLWRREYPYQSGKRFALTLPRKFVCDLLHQARKIPLVPLQRRMELRTLVDARRAASHQVGWCAIFTKAYAIVSAARPELRRAYLGFPLPHLYEHPGTVASVGIEREYEGEFGVFFGRVPSPERISLVALETLLRYYKTAPLDKIPSFRAALRLSRLPRPLRRFVWWFGLNARGLYRSSLFGTFGISVVAALGGASLHLLSPLTTALNYGTFTKEGVLDVRLTYDHRVMDGAIVARSLAHLEEVLNGQIAAELQAIRSDCDAHLIGTCHEIA